jgi:hypothetical protein
MLWTKKETGKSRLGRELSYVLSSSVKLNLATASRLLLPVSSALVNCYKEENYSRDKYKHLLKTK